MHCHLSSTKVEFLSIFHTRPIECYSCGLLEVYIVDVNNQGQWWFAPTNDFLMGTVSYKNTWESQKSFAELKPFNVNQVGSPIVKLKIMSDI